MTDKFIPWAGGSCPVAPDVVVEVKLRGGASGKASAANINSEDEAKAVIAALDHFA